MPPPEPCPFGHGTERTEANNRGNMIEKIKDTIEVREAIGWNFRSEMHYGWTSYESEEYDDLYFLLITRNGRGEELQEFYWDLEEPAKNWLRNKGIELIPYN